MLLRRVLYLLCLATAAVCLVGGYMLIAHWTEACLVMLPILAMLVSYRLQATWWPSACLVVLIGLAVVGLLQGASAYAVIPGATAALAAWDLANLDRTMGSQSSSETARQFEQKHIRTLSIALGFGLLTAAAGELVLLSVPFVLFVPLILLNVLSLNRLSRILARKRAEG